MKNGFCLWHFFGAFGVSSAALVYTIGVKVRECRKLSAADAASVEVDIRDTVDMVWRHPHFLLDAITSIELLKMRHARARSSHLRDPLGQPRSAQAFRLPFQRNRCAHLLGFVLMRASHSLSNRLLLKNAAPLGFISRGETLSIVPASVCTRLSRTAPVRDALRVAGSANDLTCRASRGRTL